MVRKEGGSSRAGAKSSSWLIAEISGVTSRSMTVQLLFDANRSVSQFAANDRTASRGGGKGFQSSAVGRWDGATAELGTKVGVQLQFQRNEGALSKMSFLDHVMICMHQFEDICHNSKH